MGVSGRDPTPKPARPRSSFKGWGEVGGAGEAPTAPTAPPHCREDHSGFSHGKALSLGVKDGESEPPKTTPGW